jgi:hypothetical protein
MNTGLSSFADPMSIGPMYPFPGSEWLLALILLVAWVGWQIYFTRAEGQEFEKAASLYRQKGLMQASSEAEAERIAAEVRETLQHER